MINMLFIKLFKGLFSKKMVASLVRHVLTGIASVLTFIAIYVGFEIPPEKLVEITKTLEPVITAIITGAVGLGWSAIQKGNE